MRHFGSARVLESVLGDVAVLRAGISEIHHLQVALGSTSSCWCSPRQRAVVERLIACIWDNFAISSTDEELLFDARRKICAGQIAAALNALDAVILPKRTY